ncbi:hypothetical protein [Allochromatium warmingii]|uniref:hypothetical protein n=1 Tax=Allochromatium warmingii TaxID=61595 RepID=UPI0015A6535D|nr:hypothetical protein [Allochromatium warmingii]
MNQAVDGRDYMESDAEAQSLCPSTSGHGKATRPHTGLCYVAPRRRRQSLL